MFDNQRTFNHFTGTRANLWIVTADLRPAHCFSDWIDNCIQEAKELRQLGFDALVFPGDIPDYVPLKDEAYV